MELSTQAAVRVAVEQVLAGRQVPGLVVAVARGNAPPWFVAAGEDAAGVPLSEESIFPVASVTKMATALCVHRLVEHGEAHLDDLLSDYLPQAAAARPGVTLRALLCHTAGLPLDVAAEDAPYAPGLDWPTLAAACLRTELEAAPRTRVQYSNVGYGLLALVVEQRTGLEFGEALRELVLGPLGIEAWLGTAPPRPTVRLARVRGEHAGTELEPFNSPFWRSLAMPWAGLFTTAAGALAIVRAYRGAQPGFLSTATLAEATRDQTGGLGGGFEPPLLWEPCPWGLGPEVRGHKTPHWVTEQASPASFGHSGASGCIAWADPAADVAFAILGARPADNGWLLRRVPVISGAIYSSS